MINLNPKGLIVIHDWVGTQTINYFFQAQGSFGSVATTPKNKNNCLGTSLNGHHTIIFVFNSQKFLLKLKIFNFNFSKC